MHGYKTLSVATQEQSSSNDLFDRYIILWMGFQVKIFRVRDRYPNHYINSAHEKVMVLLVWWVIVCYSKERIGKHSWTPASINIFDCKLSKTEALQHWRLNTKTEVLAKFNFEIAPLSNHPIR